MPLRLRKGMYTEEIGKPHAQPYSRSAPRRGFPGGEEQGERVSVGTPRRPGDARSIVDTGHVAVPIRRG